MRTSPRRTISTRIALVVGMAGIAGAVAAATAQAEPPAIPGLTAPDEFPNGCVDCHVERADVEGHMPISKVLEQWQTEVPADLLGKLTKVTPEGTKLKGKHPKVPPKMLEAGIPDSCLMCHKAGSTMAAPLSAYMHDIHLVGGAENQFLTVFGGQCTHCHKFDKATAQWSLASGSE
jgi:hypothetical protein